MSASTVTPTPNSPAVGIVYQEIDVTPELAQKWLGRNTSNRKLKPAQVVAYARDMAMGRWDLNGEFIKLAGPTDEPTKLLDGQNRLHAVLKAQVTVRMCVASNVPSGVQESMDSGSKRTVADNLSIIGTPNAITVAAAAAIALRVAEGRVYAGGNRSTNQASQDFIDANRELILSSSVAARYAYKADVPVSVVAYTHWVLAKIDLDAATAFWRDAAEKVGLESGDPIIAITNRFADARRNRERLQLAAMLSIIYRAWNYRRAGMSMKIAKINSTKGGLIQIPEPR